ncbi:MAG: hypothetical protein ACHQ1F_08045 [Spirochaetia bacterium]
MMLMMAGTGAEFESYLKWSREELKAQVAFMRSFAKDLEDAGVLVMTEGLAFPDQGRPGVRRAGSKRPGDHAHRGSAGHGPGS